MAHASITINIANPSLAARFADRARHMLRHSLRVWEGRLRGVTLTLRKQQGATAPYQACLQFENDTGRQKIQVDHDHPLAAVQTAAYQATIRRSPTYLENQS